MRSGGTIAAPWRTVKKRRMLRREINRKLNSCQYFASVATSCAYTVVVARRALTIREVEIKLRITDIPALLRRIRGLGVRPGVRIFEQNILYDTPESDVWRRGQLLRLRIETLAPDSSPRRRSDSFRHGRSRCHPDFESPGKRCTCASIQGENRNRSNRARSSGVEARGSEGSDFAKDSATRNIAPAFDSAGPIWTWMKHLSAYFLRSKAHPLL